MKKTRILVDWYDDLELAQGKEVEADETVQLVLDGKPVEIDLSAYNARRLRAWLEPWMAAGHRPAPKLSQTPHVVKYKPDGQKSTALAPTLPESRALGKRIMAWLDHEHNMGQHLDLSYTTPKKGRYYSGPLRAEYFAWHPDDAAKYQNWHEREQSTAGP